jgi:hypothetical protein
MKKVMPQGLEMGTPLIPTYRSCIQDKKHKHHVPLSTYHLLEKLSSTSDKMGKYKYVALV